MTRNQHRDLLLIDHQVDRLSLLAEDAAGRADIHVLGPDDDALAIATRLLASRDDVALHLVGHGAPGAILLGNAQLDREVVLARDALLDGWRGVVSEIVLYGCETGQGDRGQGFVSTLVRATGADVRAASGVVGAAEMGGSWHLDVGARPGAASVLFSQALQRDYPAALATVTFDVDPPFAIEDEQNPVSFTFSVESAPGEAAPSPENPVRVYLFASDSDDPAIFADGTLSGDARVNQISQLDLFALQTTGVDFDPIGRDDVSVISGASPILDFTVFEIRLTAPEARLDLAAFNEFGFTQPVDSYFWRVVDAPGGADNTIVNGAVAFTEVETRADLPATNTEPSAANDTATTAFGMAVQVDVLANDSDADGDALSIDSVGTASNGTVTIAQEAGRDVAVYTPDAGFSGEDSFTYTVSDGAGGTAQATATITVSAAPNSAPQAAADQATTSAATAVEIDVLANDTDADGDTLTLTSVGTAANGTVVIDDRGTADAADDVAVYTPDAGFSGEDSFTYEISDGEGGTSQATATVQVSAPAATPVVSLTTDTTTLIEDEGTQVTFTFNVENLPEDGLTVALGAYRPGDSGTDLLDRALGDFDLNPFSLPPVTGIDGRLFGFNGNSGVDFTINAETATITLPIFDDVDIPPDAPGGNANTDVGVEEQVWRLIDFSLANPPFDTVDSYDVAEGAGEVTLTLRDTAEVENTAPTAADDSYEVQTGGQLNIDAAAGVLANDGDADGDALTAVIAEGPSSGTVTLAEDGSFSYSPDAGFVGSDSFTYTASDGQGGSATGSVTLAVNAAPNTDPVAADDSATTVAGAAVTVDVLANDSDANGDSLTITSVAAVTGGTAVIDDQGTEDTSDDTIVYTPDAGTTGEQTFTYAISDGAGGTSEATVTVQVDAPPPTNTDPVAADDSATTEEGVAVELDLLANDSDADGDALTLTSVGSAANGTVAIDDRGTVDVSDDVAVYTPDAGFSGEDSFTYTISDGAGGTAEASVTVTVEPGTTGGPIVGTDGDETLVGTDGDDVINALGGDDIIIGGLGDDVLSGGPFDRNVFVIESETFGNDTFVDFDINEGNEISFDRLEFVFNGEERVLSLTSDFVSFTEELQSDGLEETAALIDGENLIFELGNGNSLRFNGDIDGDSLTLQPLLDAGADQFVFA